MKHLALCVVCVVFGCQRRPVEVVKANEFKRALLAEAIDDVNVRYRAYQKTAYEAELEKLDTHYRMNMAQIDNVMTIDGVPYIIFVAHDGTKQRETVAGFVRRVVALRDANREKLLDAERRSQVEDDKVNRKLAAVMKLDTLTEQYNRAVENDSVSANDLNKLIEDVITAVQPLIRRD